MEPADVARYVDASTEARRREDAVVAQRAERGQARLAILRRRTPDVLLADLLRHEAWRPLGKRLRRRRVSRRARRYEGRAARGWGRAGGPSAARTERDVRSSIPPRPRGHPCQGRAAAATPRRSPTDRDARSGTTMRRHLWRRAARRSALACRCRLAADHRNSQDSRFPSAETRDHWRRQRSCGTTCSRRRHRRSREEDETSIAAPRDAASKARTSPDDMRTRLLSATDEPTMTRSR